MKKFFSSVLAAAISTLLLTPASAEHEWSVNGSVIENDLWTLTASWNNGALTLSGATPKDGSLTTLDVSEMNIGGKLLNSINSWQNSNILTVKKLIIPYTMSNFSTEVNALPALEEICTPDGGHELSIGSWGKTIINTAKLSGDYVIKDVTSLGSQNQGGIMSCYDLTSLEFRGSYATISPSAAFLNCGLKSISFNTTGAITTIPSQLCGWYGNQTPSQVAMPIQLTSLTLNGKPLLRCADITQVGVQAMPHATLYADIIDLPSCTSVGEYAFRYDESIPFINLMSVTSLGQYCFGSCSGLSRVVFGAQQFAGTIAADILSGQSFASEADASVIWNCTSRPSFNGPCYRDIDKSTKEIKNYVRKEAGWLVENWGSRPYIKQDDAGQWCLYDWNNKTIRQPLIAMDTVFKVNLRLDNNIVMTTLMPGVSGENPTWTIPASWFLGSGKTFGEGTVKDADGNVIDGATAIPDGTGLNLTIMLPATLVKSVDGTTQDDEVFVDMVAQENKDPQITVKIVDEDAVTIVEDVFEATVGTSVTKEYGATILGDSEYYYNKVLSQTVDPETALTASLDLFGKLTLSDIAKDATVTIKIDRTARPTQLAYWNVDTANYSMSDGVWTFRCDFTGGKAVIADAIRYNGADYDVVEVDFTKPIGTDGSSDYQVTTLDWGSTINGSAVQIKADNQCGKNVVINGGAGTAATLVGALKIPDTVKSIAGWGYCANLTMDLASLVQIDKFGKYALARTSIAGALVLSDASPVEVGDYAFDRCAKLTSLKVPALGSTIGESAFYACTGMKTIELDGVTSIKWAAFSRDSAPWIEKVVLSPALTNLGINAFYKSVKSGCIFDAVSPRDMPAAKSGDGVIAANVFQDIGANSIVIPFKGTCTIGDGAFHFSMTTNFIFWGKAPANWAHEAGAEFSENVSKIFRAQFNGNVKTDRMFTVSLTMDKAGWESVATKLKRDCTDGEWTALNPPATAFGWVMVAEKTDGTNQKRVWLCEGTSPWESVAAHGLKIIIR